MIPTCRIITNMLPMWCCCFHIILLFYYITLLAIIDLPSNSDWWGQCKFPPHLHPRHLFSPKTQCDPSNQSQCAMLVADGNPTAQFAPASPPPSTDCLLCFVGMWKCKSQLRANVDNMCYLRWLLIAHRCPAEPLGHPPQIFLPFTLCATGCRRPVGLFGLWITC